MAYDGDGNAVDVRDPAGGHSLASYDPVQRLVSATNPVGAQTLYSYSATRLTAVEDPRQCSTAYAYDGAGRLQRVTAPVAGARPGAVSQDLVTAYGYDAAGNLTSVTGNDGTASPPTQTETRAFDAQNNLISSALSGTNLASPLTTGLAYDGDGNLTQRTAPNGDTTINFYNLADELGQRWVVPSGATAPSAQETFGYDGAGNPASHTDFAGNLHLATYDGDNRPMQQLDELLGVSGTTNITTTTGFDPDGIAAGRLVAAADGSTHTITPTVNAADWPAGVDSDGLTTAYGYDLAGRPRTQTLSGLGPSLPITLTVDGAGRTTPFTAALTYDGNDQPTGATASNGLQETRQYDPGRRLSGITTTTQPQHFLPFAYGYSYEATGLTKQITFQQVGTSVSSYVHDAAGRLYSVSSGAFTKQWAYDGDGNLTGTLVNGSAANGTAYSLDPAHPNQLLSTTPAGGATTYYGYDTGGRATSIGPTRPGSAACPDPATPDTADTRLCYDAQGRLVRATVPDGGQVKTITITYNGAGQRAAYLVAEPGKTTLSEVFGYSGDRVALLRVSGAGAASAGQQACAGSGTSCSEAFVYRPDGAPLELLYTPQVDSSPGPVQRYWYILDGQGSAVGLTDALGGLHNDEGYDDWGTPTGTPGEGTGWYWLAVRNYDPALERFLQPDPSKREGSRSYVYAGVPLLTLLTPPGWACASSATSAAPQGRLCTAPSAGSGDSSSSGSAYQRASTATVASR